MWMLWNENGASYTNLNDKGTHEEGVEFKKNLQISNILHPVCGFVGLGSLPQHKSQNVNLSLRALSFGRCLILSIVLFFPKIMLFPFVKNNTMKRVRTTEVNFPQLKLLFLSADYRTQIICTQSTFKEIMHTTDPQNKLLIFSFLVWNQNFIKSNKLFQ